MWELDYKKSWAQKNWCFWTVVLEKMFEGPLDRTEIKSINPKGTQSWIFIERTDAEAEASVLWPLDSKDWLIRKDPDTGKDWRWEEKRTAEDEIDSWMALPTQWTHVWASSGSCNGQGSLMCCSPCGLKELDTTQQLNWLTDWGLSEGLLRCH